MVRPWALLGLLALACSLRTASAQAGDMQAWAAEIARLMGGSGVPASSNPDGIVQTHTQIARPADGLLVDEQKKQDSQHQYVWQGPVSAGSGTLPIVQKHPYAVLALQTIGFLKLMKVVQERRPPRRSPPPPPSPSPPPPFKPPTPDPPIPSFVAQVDSGNFVVGSGDGTCSYIYPAGFNKFEFVEAGAAAPILYDARLTEPGLTGPAMVRRMLDQAAASKLSLLRMNAFAVDLFYKVLSQEVPGVSDPVANEGVLRGLDYVLSEAQKRGIRVLPVLTDYNVNAGGPIQYLQFAGVDTRCGYDSFPSCQFIFAQFYTNERARQYFKQYAQLLITRRNTVNGRLYSEDPTILGWDLMNEPRCEVEGCVNAETRASLIGDWVNEMADFVHSLDSNHLVTVGLDGFYIYPPGLATNPFSVAADYGSDFVEINKNSKLDFAEFNVYPDLWNQASGFTWLDSWIQQHSDDARGAALAKPAIIKEFGMAPYTNGVREAFYTAMVDKQLSTLAADRTAVGGLKGGLYFQGWAEGTTSVWFTLDPAGRTGVLPSDPAYAQVQRLAEGALELQSSLPCPNNPRLAPVFPPVLNCPVGFEGASCNVDIDECARGLDDCDVNAACINTVGSYTCQCRLTYTGSGRAGDCAAAPAAQAAVLGLFRTYADGGGNLLRSNKQGEGFAYVPYPETAPGWNPDPTGYYTSTPQLAASSRRLNMTALECALACQTAGEDECTSFFYNKAAQSCILRRNECFNEPNLVLDTPAPCTYPLYELNTPLPVGDQTVVCGFGYTYFRTSTLLPAGCIPT
ncbi:hypothetical protein ABPG75_008068 [Micractinium tetrahymenae]